MSAPNPQTATGSDLDWVALCYVGDELSAEDREVFEDRLAGDLAACEAVSRAMQLAESTALVFSVAAASEPDCRRPVEASAPRRESRRVTIGVAVAVATVLLAVVPFVRQTSEPVVVEQDTRHADAIVAMWTGSRDLVTDSEHHENETQPPATDVVESDSAPEVAAADLEVGSSVDVPAWLLAAVKAESEATSAVLEN